MPASSGLPTRYMHDELAADTSSGGVSHTVFVECGWRYDAALAPHLRPVGETREVLAVAGDLVAGIVASCDLELPADQLGDILDAHEAAGGGRFRGIRHRLAHDNTGSTHKMGQAEPGLAGRDAFRAGLTELGRRGHSFEAWCYHPQLPEIVDLARTVPGTTIVLNHLGGPINAGVFAGRADEVRDAWSQSMMELAACPNVVLKLGGVGMASASPWWTAEGPLASAAEIADRWGSWIDFATDAFGADRCMFESNFPVDSVSFTYAEMWSAFEQMAASRPAGEQADLFAGTANRVYRLGRPA